MSVKDILVVLMSRQLIHKLTFTYFTLSCGPGSYSPIDQIEFAMHAARLVTCLLFSLSYTSAYYRASSIIIKPYISNSCIRKATYASSTVLKMSNNEVDAGMTLNC